MQAKRVENCGKALFMQLTQDVNNVSEEELIRLKGYFEYIDQAYWDGLDVTIYFKKNLSEEDANSLNEVFENWYAMANNNEFQGKIYYISNFWIEENQAGFRADMGSTNGASINTFILLLKT